MAVKELPSSEACRSASRDLPAEVSIPLAAVPAMRAPRSAPTFSSAGELGVRIVPSESIVKFVPVSLVADNQDEMFVNGITPASRIIVQGQDFVREGQTVTAVPATVAVGAAQ